eukprot:CAMPEP_0113662762 /NCGR_PEP_ID=MMETSP0038_2-20120614/760_1 /TAXON_ID=2898 /ORGANISM="Cryptomonas paramecium" /LENGTH=390 /DNA_ID=CAMNT_0000577701 /DNA_START=8 /DNA_END=1178 /DNA_ORIENTATION=+ /assembly_acc=CAM_ASM_000170
MEKYKEGLLPVRSAENASAYNEFVHSLEQIHQLPNQQHLHAKYSTIKVRRNPRTPMKQMVDQLDTAKRFRDYLEARAVGGVPDENASSTGAPSIREETLLLLTSPPEAPFTLVSMGQQILNIAMLGYTIMQQFDAISDVQNAVEFQTRWGAVTRILLTVPLFRLLSMLSLALLGEFLRRVDEAAEKAHCQEKISSRVRNWVRGGVKSMKSAAKKQFEVLETLLLHLSSSWRILVVIKQVAKRTVNPSAKDFKSLLTMTSNLMFSMVLLSVQVERSDEVQGLLITLAINVFKLLMIMAGTFIKIDMLSEAMRDMNENRLSKFELSLLMVKQMEMLLDEDVQFNFVEHFRSSEPLRPFADSHLASTSSPGSAPASWAGLSSAASADSTPLPS